MTRRFSIFIISWLLSQMALGQVTFSTVRFDTELKDSFSFAKNWDYPWDILKSEDGKFSAADGRKIKARDTARLYFTANCSTNVQGGYTIRYCTADRVGDTLRLLFSDGLPAYASTFYIYVIGDSFYFKPKTVYPAYSRGEKYSYTTIKQQLTLNKPAYKNGDLVLGVVEITFTESLAASGVDTSLRQYFLKGFIRTPLKRK